MIGLWIFYIALFVWEVGLKKSSLNCIACGRGYPIINNIPRFVEDDSYCNSFSKQWKVFRTTQSDAHREIIHSELRFKSETGWNENDFENGTIILDAGCATGRFSEVALKWRAKIIAVDLSASV